MIIYSRSPYFVTVNEALQIGSKIELRLWNGLGAEPTLPTYTFSKPIASSIQTENVYNISPFIKEYIDNVAPIYAATEVDSVFMWVNVSIKRFKEVSVGNYTLLDSTNYLGTNGYSSFINGFNYSNPSNTFMLLSDNSKEIKYDIKKQIPYVNALINLSINDVITATYKDLRGRNQTLVNYTEVKGMLKIPLSTNNVKYDKGNTLTINYNSTIYEYKVIPICEPKYEPVICSFINRFGGWQFLTFFKTRIDTINIKGSNYNLLQESVNYNVSKGQSKSFNINGNQTIKLSSGFVPENYSDLIQDLLLSETVLLDGIPVEVKTQSTVLKKSLIDKNINYEMDFQYAFNLINNVI